MVRFLHLADIHLGFDRYNSRERTKDFFLALQDVIRRYAIAERVDFVLIAGDLFEHRSIQPAILNQAQICLGMLQQAGIPVLAIEGNHDNLPYGTRTSWLHYLADWGQLILLEPGDVATGEAFYTPWNGKRGGYIDLDCGARVLGSHWYGAAAPQAIGQIAAAIQDLPPHSGPTILMFHHGLENQVARYAGALRYSDLLPLKQAGVDYLALGHIHKQYDKEGWIFNPGSLEANNIEESRYTRGVYLVEINEEGTQAQLKQDYYQRPVVRLQMTAKSQDSPEEVEAQAIALIQTAVGTKQIEPTEEPIVELRIDGQVGFERLELDIRQLQLKLQALSNALIFLLKYEVDAVAYASPLSDQASRLQIEQEVFTDLLAEHNTYKKQAVHLAKGLIDLKERQLAEQADPDLYDFAWALLQGDSSE
jgi:exonuclease SbcD